MIDKPTMNRDRVLHEEHRRRSLRRCLAHAARHLGADECLGLPARRGDELVFPVRRRRTHVRADAPSSN